MKKLPFVSLVLMLAMGLVSVASAQGLKLILATGGTAGTYYPFGGAMAKIWNSRFQG